MRFDFAQLVETAELNAAASREITDAQRSVVEKLTAEGRDTTVPCEMLRVAETTQEMFEAHLRQLRQAFPRPKAPAHRQLIRATFS